MGRINNFVSRVVVALLLMLCGFSSGVWAEKVTPTIKLSTKVLSVIPGQVGVSAPTANAQVEYANSDFFNVYFEVDGGRPYETNQGYYTIDDVTGTQVEKTTHKIIVGNKPGTIKVKVTAEPKKGYGLIYNSCVDYFTIVVAKGKPSVYLMPYGDLTAYSSSDNKVALPKKYAVKYKIGNLEYNLTSGFNVVWKAKKNVTIVGDSFYGKVVGEGALEYTFVPDAENAVYYESVKGEVKVNVIEHTASTKKKTYLFYPDNGVQTVFACLSGNAGGAVPDVFTVYSPKVIDEQGKDITNLVNIPADGQWLGNNYSINEKLSDAGRHASIYQRNVGSIGNSQPGDLKVDSTDRKDVFNVKFPFKDYWDGGVHHNLGTDNGYDDNVTGLFTIVNTPRVPKVYFDPEPSTVVFRTGYLIDYLNQFTPRAVWHDPDRNTDIEMEYCGSGETGFNYFYYIDIEDLKKEQVAYKTRTNEDDKDWKELDVNTISRDKLVHIDGKDYVEFQTMKGWGAADYTWNIEIKAPVQFNMKYGLKTYTGGWFIFDPKFADLVVDVRDRVKTTMNLDPKTIVAAPNQKVKGPKVTITTLDGEKIDHQVSDPSESLINNFYDISYQIVDVDKTNTNKSSMNSSTGEFTVGNGNGKVLVKVTATPKADMDIYNSVGNRMVNPYEPNVAYYEVIVDPDYANFFEIVNSKSPNAKAKVSLPEGKLHFVKVGGKEKEHQYYPGTSFTGVPGLDVTLGYVNFDGEKYDENSQKLTYEVRKQSSFTAVSTDDDYDVDNQKYYLTVPATGLTISDDSNIPSDAIILKPYTNGFLTVGYRTNPSNKLVLAAADGTVIKEVSCTTPGYNELNFNSALLGGNKYYLYSVGSAGNAFHIHGISYQPAYIKHEGDAEPTTLAYVSNTGNGALPTIINEESSNVKFASTPTDGIASVDANTGEVSFDTDKKNDTYIKATVNTTYNNVAIVKTASYLIKIQQLPMYVVKDKEQPSLVEGNNKNKKKGQVHGYTTTNYDTDINMYYGGYMINGKPLSYKSTETGIAIVDGWKKAKDDAVKKTTDSNDGAIIDGFAYGSQGEQDALDETYQKYYQYNYKKDNSGSNNTFTLPNHGAYIKFEPRESGTLMVYLVQNGMCDYQGPETDLETLNSDYYTMKWRPLYIVDQTGKSVELNDTYNGKGTGAYTKGLVRSTCIDKKISTQTGRRKGTIRYANSDYDWSKFLNWYTEGADGTQKAALENDAKGLINQFITEWKDKNVGDPERIIPLGNADNRQYVLLHKAYVRYTFDVKAGNTYFVFQAGSKISPCGYTFVPDDWDPKVSMKERQNNRPVVNLDNNVDYENNETRDNVNVNMVNRTFKDNTWASICLPFNVSQQEFYRVFGDGARIIDFKGVEDVKGHNIAKFTQHDYRMIEAGRPYFICPTKVDNQVQFQHVTFTNPDPSVYEVKTDEFYNMVGTFKNRYMKAYSYALGGDGKLYRYDDETNIKPFRAYLEFKGTPADAKAWSLWSMGNDEVTAIPVINVTNENTNADNLIYNLQGQCVGTDKTKLVPGIYILEGKKIIVK